MRGPTFFIFFEKRLDKYGKMCGLFANYISKKAFVIRGVPTENYKEAYQCQIKF